MRTVTSTLVVLLAVSTLCKIHQDALYRSQGGVKLKLGIYKRWQARSRIHCSQRCLQDSDCWGYNFNKASRQCQYGVRMLGEHTFESSQQDVSFGVVDMKTNRSRPLSSFVINKRGARTSVIIGGALSCLGLVLSSFATGVYFLMFSFGTVTGAGLGFGYVGAFMVIAKRFENRRGVALGITSAGFGIGIFVYPYLIEAATHHYGWRGSLMLLGGLSLNMCVCGALMFPVYKPESHHATKGKETCSSTSQMHNTVTVLTGLPFVILCCHCVLSTFGWSVFTTHMPFFASRNIGLSDSAAASLISTSGIAGAISRIVLGMLLNLPTVDSEVVMMSCYILMGVVVSCIPLATNYTHMSVLSALCGATVAAAGPVLGEITLLYTGPKPYVTGFGFVSFFYGVGTVFGAPSAGWLFDAVGIYSPSFYLGGTSIFLSGVIFLIPFCMNRFGIKRHPLYTFSQEETHVNDPLFGPIMETTV